MFALTWRCDGTEGVTWRLRGIRNDGSFYGEIRWRKAVTATGRLSPAERERMAELVGIIGQAVRPIEPGPHFGALFERLSPTNAGDVRRLFEYRLGDEDHSESARAFVELVGLIERHLSPFYKWIA